MRAQTRSRRSDRGCSSGTVCHRGSTLTGGHPDIAMVITLAGAAIVGLVVYAAGRAQGYSRPFARNAAVIMWLVALAVVLSSRFVFVGDREALGLPVMAAAGGVGAAILTLIVVYRQRAAMRKAGRR